MKESLGSAIHSSDLGTKRGEGATDRLGAMAFGNETGISFMWAQLTGESRRFLQVVNNIADKLKLISKYKFGDILKISSIATFELMFPHCRNCSGATAIKTDKGIVANCDKCDGTGAHRYSDKDRSSLFGKNFNNKHAELLSKAQNMLTTSESLALWEIKRQLER